VQIRLCQIEDLPQVKAILEKSPEASDWSMEVLLEALTQHAKYFLVATQQKEIMGFISGRRILDEGEILNLAVKEVVRRRGIASNLLQVALEFFQQDHALQAFLEVRESNLPAVHFYTKAGFHQIGRRPTYYRNPDEAALVLAHRF
jgi:[ribosomal protein S18]-alanine N-acetyltransferase